MAASEEVASFIRKITEEELPAYCDAYRWLSEILIEEDLHRDFQKLRCAGGVLPLVF